MRAVEALLDSNVLIYALPRDPRDEDARKQEIARKLIAESDFGVSYQVLMETFVAATRKFRRPLAPVAVAKFLEPFLAFPVAEGTPALWRESVRLAARFNIHPYDAAIVAAARDLGAATVYSEDLADGQDYDGVKVVNPFKD